MPPDGWYLLLNNNHTMLVNNQCQKTELKKKKINLSSWNYSNRFCWKFNISQFI